MFNLRLMLLLCFGLLNQPFGKIIATEGPGAGKTAAATKIQARWRGHRARTRSALALALAAKKNAAATRAAATRIQARWRRYRTRVGIAAGAAEGRRGRPERRANPFGADAGGMHIFDTRGDRGSSNTATYCSLCCTSGHATKEHIYWFHLKM